MKTVAIFTYNELSDEAKEFAYKKWLDSEREFYFGNDWLTSIKKGLDHFDFRLNDWQIDYYCASKGFFRLITGHDREVIKLTGIELKDYILGSYPVYYDLYTPNKLVEVFEGNAPFTGMCYDEEFLQPIKDFLKEPYNITFFELMKLAVKAALKGLENDYEYSQSKEYFEQEAESNEYEYFINGREY